MNDSRTPKKLPLAVGVGARIKEQRKARSWSQRELSARANISYSRLSKYETGFHQVPLGALVRIARVMALPVDALLPDTGDTPADSQDAELLARLRSVMVLGPEEKALACSLLGSVLAMQEVRKAWQTSG